METKFELYLEKFNLQKNIYKLKSIGGKADDDIAYWIIDQLKKGINLDKYEHEYLYTPGPDQIWKYAITKIGEINPLDPLGEEDWGPGVGNKNIDIKIEKHKYYNGYTYYYMFIVNDEVLKVSENLIKRIIDLLEEPAKKENDEMLKRINQREKEKKKRLKDDIFT